MNRTGIKKVCKPEMGGGPRNVERRVSRSINDMYKRLIATGELQNAMQVKADNYHGDAKRAKALMNNAMVSPNYMRDGELKDVQHKMVELDKKLKTKDAQRKKQAEMKIEVDKALAEREVLDD